MLLDLKEILERLEKLYEIGIYNIPFYQNKIGDKSTFSSYEKFLTLPFSYKQEIRDSSVFDRTSTKISDIYGIFSSGGTTGNKTYYVFNKNDKHVHETFIKTFFTEMGVNDSDLGGVFAPVDTGIMAHTMMWQFTTMVIGYINCPIPTPENIMAYISSLPITIIATRPSVVTAAVTDTRMATIAQTSNVRILALGGGILTEKRRKFLEEKWGAECYNLLGMSEVFGPLACECKEKNGLHYLSEYLFVEIIDPATKIPVPDGCIGVPVYTTLWDKGFPLLRYWSNDLAYIDFSPCKCGSNNPRIYVLGRLDDCYIISNRYVLPKDIEEVLFTYEFYGEFFIITNDNKIELYVESDKKEIDLNLIDKLTNMFEKKVEIIVVPPSSLHYDGHAKRIITKDEFESLGLNL
ncbi:MAG: AMP-binding protein [Bacteroidales bacterium]|nr:AMP-binding protein [Bacteroidales bacterium]